MRAWSDAPLDFAPPIGDDGTTTTLPAKRSRRSYGKQPRWTAEEETALIKLVGELGTSSWDAVATRLETQRTGAGVSQHWQLMSGARKQHRNASRPPRAPARTAGSVAEQLLLAAAMPVGGLPVGSFSSLSSSPRDLDDASAASTPRSAAATLPSGKRGSQYQAAMLLRTERLKRCAASP